jgi:hypothetical protein
MFEKATRMKLRFATNRGSLNVEDLWDLSLQDLDTIALEHQKEAETKNKSFIQKVEKKDRIAVLRFKILKHIIDVKMAESERAQKAAETREKKRRILDLIAKKQDEELADSSIDDLQEMLADL